MPLRDPRTNTFSGHPSVYLYTQLMARNANPKPSVLYRLSVVSDLVDGGEETDGELVTRYWLRADVDACDEFAVSLDHHHQFRDPVRAEQYRKHILCKAGKAHKYINGRQSPELLVPDCELSVPSCWVPSPTQWDEV